MGQYFKPAITTADGTQYSINFHGCSKMMEWGYLFNTNMMVLLEHLASFSLPVRYAHAGDYSEKHDGYNFPHAADDVVEAALVLGRAFEDDETSFDINKDSTLGYYLYNHSKHEMVSLRRYHAQAQGNEVGSNDDPDWALHPLALLCCTEQGLGGGDFRDYFRGSDLKEGGHWLNDEISVSRDVLPGFVDITHECIVTGSAEEFDTLVVHLKEPFVLDESAFGQF